MNNIKDIMRQANPPKSLLTKTRKTSPHKATLIRKQQLLDNPTKWFVWYENAKTPSTTRHLIARLSGLSADELKGFKSKDAEFEAVRSANADGTYTVYVRYMPKNKFAESYAQ